MFDFSRSLTRVRQSLNKNQSSFPYLSGDTFKALSDFSFSSENDFQTTRDWRNVRVVFCKSDLFELFDSLRPSNLNPKVIICGNSDFDFHSIELKSYSGLKAIFLQNSFVSDQKLIYTLPIGLENARYSSNGRTRLFSNSLTTSKLNKVLVGPFGNTHSERIPLMEMRSDISRHCIGERVNTKNHLRNLDSFKYVACPRGNGVDTHRVWESMYRGAIPVLVRNPWSQSLFDFGFPIILLDSWNEISHVINKDSLLNPSQIRNSPFLWMPSWEKLIFSFL